MKRISVTVQCARVRFERLKNTQTPKIIIPRPVIMTNDAGRRIRDDYDDDVTRNKTHHTSMTFFRVRRTHTLTVYEYTYTQMPRAMPIKTAGTRLY